MPIRHGRMHGTQGADRCTHRRARAIAFGSLVFVVLGAVPAAAHTSLAGSQPADGTTVERAPEELRLELTSAVPPETVRLVVTEAETGASLEGVLAVTPDGEPTTGLTWSLPPLEDGVYGARWTAVGEDGHQASSEIIFGVGQAVGDGQAVTATTPDAENPPRALAIVGAIGRLAWYAGLALVAGSLWLVWWAAGPGHGPGVRRSTAVLTASARRWAALGLPIGLLGAALAWTAILGTHAAGVRRGGSPLAAVLDGYLSRSSTLWLAAGFVVVALWRHVAMDPRSEPDAPFGRRRLLALAIGLVAITLLSTGAGHAVTSPQPMLAAALGAAHLLAALTWAGPLAVVSLTVVTARWRSVDATERNALLRRLFSGFAPVGGWSFAALVATGVHLGWSSLGAKGGALTTSYGWTLLAKLALVAFVVVPLAWNHDLLVRRWRARGGELGRRAPGGPSFLRTVRVEALGLAAVLAMAAMLVGLDPGGQEEADLEEAPAALALATPSAPTDDLEGCAELSVGGSDCYESFFVELMERDGAEAAVARIEELSATDEYVRSDCHQLTHTVGRAAAGVYDSLAEALSFQASACWSGYYHGVVEETMAGYDDEELEAAMPRVCEPAAAPRYGFSHYNCVHGIGHGVMIRQDADLFATLPFCDALGDEWERSACAGGAFMQNVIAAQGGEEATFDEDDQSYPCSAVDEGYRDDCWQMQTSWVLWRNGYDYSAGFAVCDGVESDVADDCYQSMGRDISGNFSLDPERVTKTCALGADELEVHCVVGAAYNAVYDTHDIDRADDLCAVVDPRHQGVCRQATESAASSL